jgi:ectoine hydroxylase-related dioxygenase (phytanoyl-CoA dioxygenase family)
VTASVDFATVFPLADHVRMPTEEEIAFFREHGWVKLDGMVSEELAGELLGRVQQVTGLHAEELPQGDEASKALLSLNSTDSAQFRFSTMPRFEDDLLRWYQESKELGEISARLSGVRPLRLFTESLIYKLPYWTGSGEVTPWHQDENGAPYAPKPDIGHTQTWLALCEITPEMGPMQHMSGSQHHPGLEPTGQSTLEDLLEAHPQLQGLEVSALQHYMPGDAVLHNGWTLHFAAENRTDRIRWAITSARIPDGLTYTGKAANANLPSRRSSKTGYPWLDNMGFEPGDPLAHELLPIVTA